MKTELAANELSAEALASRAIARRAVEAVIWGMPAVNAELMFQAMRDAKADFNQVVYWSRPAQLEEPDAHAKPRHDLCLSVLQHQGRRADGAGDSAGRGRRRRSPAASTMRGRRRSRMSDRPAWTRARAASTSSCRQATRRRRPTVTSRCRRTTYTGFVILRSNLKSGSDADIAKAVAYGKRVKFYPLSQAANPPATKFVDAIDVVFDSTIPYDLRFFQTLDRFVQREPWLTRDKVMIDQLKTIGIEKGKPFNPDAKTQKILNDAAREAHAWLDHKYEGVFSPPFNEGTHWALPASPGVAEGLMTNFANPDAYPVEGRGVAYSMAYFSAKHLGEGQFYLMTIVDKAGKPLDGGSTYRLNVPANAPVKLYWSATAYDRATHALIREHAVVEPLVQHAGASEERRRFSGHLLWTQGS